MHFLSFFLFSTCFLFHATFSFFLIVCLVFLPYLVEASSSFLSAALKCPAGLHWPLVTAALPVSIPHRRLPFLPLISSTGSLGPRATAGGAHGAGPRRCCSLVAGGAPRRERGTVVYRPARSDHRPAGGRTRAAAGPDGRAGRRAAEHQPAHPGIRAAALPHRRHPHHRRPRRRRP